MVAVSLHVRHIRVVVLAGVNQGLDDLLARLERIHHGRHFHEIWASANDVKYVHSFSDQRETRLNYLRLNYLGPNLSDENRGNGKDLERVGRSRHRRCDPGRAHRLLHPRLLAIHRRSAKVDSMTDSP